MSVTVYTASGNTWKVARGASCTAQPTMTGDLWVDVYSTPLGQEQKAQAWLAHFGTVETAYLDGEVELVSSQNPAPARGL